MFVRDSYSSIGVSSQKNMSTNTIDTPKFW